MLMYGLCIENNNIALITLTFVIAEALSGLLGTVTQSLNLGQQNDLL